MAGGEGLWPCDRLGPGWGAGSVQGTRMPRQLGAGAAWPAHEDAEGSQPGRGVPGAARLGGL